METTETYNPIDFVLSARNCTQSELARQIGVKRATIASWKSRGFIPPKNVKTLSEVTGVPTYILCPEFFPAPKKAKE